MNLLLNMALAVSVGVTVIFLYALAVTTLAWVFQEAHGNVQMLIILKFLAAIALCGFLGAVFIQAFGGSWWVT